MELFLNGGFVRLQSRANGKYVHADGDWEGVSLRPLGAGTAASLEAVWRVEHWVMDLGGGEEITFVKLQNAAYGRYLSFSHLDAPRGHRGHRVVQDDRNDQPPAAAVGQQHAYAFLWLWRWKWMVERVHAGQDYVRLLHGAFHLRANGRHRTWNNQVTADVVDYEQGNTPLTTMMQWTVHAVEPTPVPLPLPDAPPQPQIKGRLRGLLFWRRTSVVHHLPPRTIRHVRATDQGQFDENHENWPTALADDHSVYNLRIQLGQLQPDWNGDMLHFTLCMRPGLHGRLMPLVTDLPRSLAPMNIIVLRTGSPAAAALVYPQIAAPAQ